MPAASTWATNPSTVGKTANQRPTQPGGSPAAPSFPAASPPVHLLHRFADHHHQDDAEQDAVSTSIRL